MTKSQTYFAQMLVLMICIVYSTVMRDRLPDIVPTHWNIEGKVDGYGPKFVSLWLIPCIMVGLTTLTFLLPLISPKKFEIDRFASTFGTAMFLITLLMAALHYVIVDATLHAVAQGAAPGKLGTSYDIGKPMMVVLFLFFAAIGNLMGKVKQNFFMGVRTPWTLSDERVWNKTHREAGVLWLVGGIAGAVLSGLGLPLPFTIALLLVITLTPVVRSYMIYKHLNPTAKAV